MIRWGRSLFAWKPRRNSGVWLYWENAVTGQRCAELISSAYQPLDWSWMRNGDLVIGRNGRFIIGSDDEVIYGGGGHGRAPVKRPAPPMPATESGWR